jgi:hypothetical protein
MSSLFGADEKSAGKRSAHGFFLVGLVSSITFFFLLIVDGSSLLLSSTRGGIRVNWPGFLWLIFSLGLTYFSLRAIIKRRRKKTK